MKNIRDVMSQARKLGVRCTERTFWHYDKLGLLPHGRKVPGYGNVMFFPDDTATRLWLIGFLTKELGFKLSDLRRIPWAEFRTVPTGSRRLPKEFIFSAKRDFEDARGACLKKVLADIATLLKDGQIASSEAAIVRVRRPPQRSRSATQNNRSSTGEESLANILSDEIVRDARQDEASERRIRGAIIGDVEN